jgi:hypothetical protein
VRLLGLAQQGVARVAAIWPIATRSTLQLCSTAFLADVGHGTFARVSCPQRHRKNACGCLRFAFCQQPATSNQPPSAFSQSKRSQLTFMASLPVVQHSFCHPFEH